MGMSGGNWLGALRRFTVRVGRLMLARLWKSFRGLAFIVFWQPEKGLSSQYSVWNRFQFCRPAAESSLPE
jgi:hypothetical protein